jgi:hypothetical protein
MRTTKCLAVWWWCAINSQRSYVYLRYENIIWFPHDNRPQMPAIQHVPELLYDNVSTILIKSQIRGWLKTTEWKNWSVVYFNLLSYHSAIPVAAPSKAWVCSCSLSWDWEFETRWGNGSPSFVNVVCYQVDVFAKGWSLVQRSPTEFGMPECDRGASSTRRPKPTSACWAIKKRHFNWRTK